MSPGMPQLASPRAEPGSILMSPQTLNIAALGDEKTQNRASVTFDASVDEDAAAKAARAKELDLVHHINGMYRLLDLISEQGSGGLGKYSPFSIACLLII